MTSASSDAEQTPPAETVDPANVEILGPAPRRTVTSPQKNLAQDPEFLAHVANNTELVIPTSVDGVDSVDERSLLIAVPGSFALHPLASQASRRHFNRLADDYTGGDNLGFLNRSGFRLVCEFLIAKANKLASVRQVFKRTAYVDNAIWLDLSQPDGSCIKITHEGWSITTPPQPIFLRLNGQRPLPIPVAADDGEDALRRLLPPGLRDDDIKLLLAALLGFKIPNNFARSFSYPILVITGESGSGKSTLAKLIAELTDNQVTTVAARPNKVDDLYVAAQTRHLLSYDNIDAVRGNLSDACCALTTGGAIEKRTLYTDGALTTLPAHVPILFNGISPDLPRQDFLDRTITLRLKRIASFNPEAGSTAAHDLPIIQGYLCDLLVTALANLPTTTLADTPRLSLVAKVATAANIPGSTMTIVELLHENQRETLTASRESDPVIAGLIELLRRNGAWDGPVGKLLAELTARADDGAVKSREWPKLPRQLSDFIREHARLLGELGVEATLGARHANGRLIHLRRLPHFIGNDAAL